MFRTFETLVDPYEAYEADDVPPRRLWPFIRAWSKPFHKVFAATVVMSVVVAAVEIWLIWYMGRLVDVLSSGPPAEVWAERRWELIGVAAFILVLRPLFQGIDVLLLNQSIMPNYGTLFRWRAHSHVLRQSVGWFENDLAGRIANRVAQTPPAAGEAVFQVFDAVTFSIAYVVGAAVLLTDADPLLMLPLLVWIGLYALLLRWVIARVAPASQRASDARSEFTGRIVDAYSNVHAVKVFAAGDRELQHGRASIENTRKTFQAEMRLYTIMDVVLVALNGLLIVGVTGFAIALWVGGVGTVGTIAAAAALVLRLSAMTGWIMWAVTSLFRQLGVIQEGMETIAQPIALTDRPGAVPLENPEGGIEIRGLAHHYGRGTDGLDGVDLDIAPGERVGIVGRSGAGKSTLVKLLLRFYDPEGGTIRIGGQEVREVTQDSLRSAISMVAQDASLLHRSVRENILYARPEASEAEMVEAARRAQAHEFILSLRDPQGGEGYEAQVGERGVKLSGGQRQRIALARAILKDAPILILDEATSALDSEVEAAIQGTLHGMMEGRTVLAIAHRLSTLRTMDRIVVLDGGRIVEEGTHDALLERGGLYARFWARQSDGFIDARDDEAA